MRRFTFYRGVFSSSFWIIINNLLNTCTQSVTICISIWFCWPIHFLLFIILFETAVFKISSNRCMFFFDLIKVRLVSCVLHFFWSVFHAGRVVNFKFPLKRCLWSIFHRWSTNSHSFWIENNEKSRWTLRRMRLPIQNILTSVALMRHQPFAR